MVKTLMERVSSGENPSWRGCPVLKDSWRGYPVVKDPYREGNQW